MAKLLLIVCAVCALAVPPALAQAQDGVNAPPASLIKPRPSRPAGEAHPVEAHPVERPRRPLDDRCRALKDQLESELQHAGAARRAFQAKLAHNAGARLCREGHPEKGMAEFQRGLSYLQEGPRS